MRVSLVNLQKLTFQAWLDTPSMKMLAPEQNTLSRALVITTADFGVLEADAVDGVVQLDIDAEVIAVELELVAGTQPAVLVEIGKQRRHGPVELELPVR